MTRNLHCKDPLSPKIFSLWEQGKKKKVSLADQAKQRKSRFFATRTRKKKK